MLVGPSPITESKYHIRRIQNKTTTVVVFTVSIHTVLSPIYIYIYKTIYLNLQIKAQPTCGEPLLVCWPSSMQEDHRRPPLYLHELKPVLSFTLSGNI